ncbi:fibrinogen-like protein A [Armigeres subalbatus]|uniref:fibrinogen-like protein A n=1 Tax=Armigeres subalbatus TaxID=124917 RepID=UPI002ED3B914
MFQLLKTILLILAIYSNLIAHAISSEEPIEEKTKCVCTELVRKIEHLESKILEQQVEIKTFIEHIVWAQQNLVQLLNENFQHKALLFNTSNHAMQSHRDEDEDHQEQSKHVFNIQPNAIRSCSEEPTKVSGKYSLHLFHHENPIEVYCEQEKFEGGLLVIQQRFDGSVDFFRNWTEYRNGFGDVDGEFWLGLETVHRLTKNRNYVLIIELQDLGGKNIYAQYDEFEIGSEAEKYSLKRLGKYNGTAGDSLSKHHKGMMFSTKDKDNDRDPIRNCATYVMGAWWYRSCLDSNLNGKYTDENKRKAITWYSFKKRLGGFRATRMMIREKKSV